MQGRDVLRESHRSDECVDPFWVAASGYNARLDVDLVRVFGRDDQDVHRPAEQLASAHARGEIGEIGSFAGAFAADDELEGSALP